MSSMTDQIRTRLEVGLSTSLLQVDDVSEQHRGHAGYQDGGESHFDVVIASDVFAGKSRIAQHRAVHKAIGKDIMAKVHALAIKIEVSEN